MLLFAGVLRILALFHEQTLAYLVDSWYEEFGLVYTVFAKHGPVNKVQISPLWSHLSEGYSRSLVVYSKAALQS